MASRAAAVRDETPILDSTAETWCCTVRSEMNSRWEISRSASPSVTRARISCSRAVSPAGADRVVARGPRGMARSPRSRIRFLATAAAALAPIPSSAVRAARRASSSAEPSRVSAAS